ncbi:FAD-binding protein [Candidatus Sumerlaeota bacterium]|nr:FAD-binding protein [Candidatus Sumerlaeota bacterium]
MKKGTNPTVICLNTVIVGSGAAALNCAEHLYRGFEERGVHRPERLFAVVTAGLGTGTSFNSGSDKQTYYRIGVQGDVADSPLDFARALTGGGCCHGDLALLEAENSAREFYHLVENGVPFPHNERGGFVGYKTDHDPRQRATSTGPWTSRFMVQKSLARLRRYNARFYENYWMTDVITVEENGSRKAVGIIAVDANHLEQPSRGMVVFLCNNVVVATGGPGDMYEISVYPRGQMGSHGALLEAGAIAANLTESQFGLASVEPRWNLSGTYQQVIPRYFSAALDGRGDERDFLNDYFADMASMCSNIFLKGYQWPFDPQRVAGSSLVDLAVYNETVFRGRRVFMDFRENPRPSPGWRPFSIADLSDEARIYLERSGATQATPIERLDRMNRPSIELYSGLGKDITREPLEIAVCAQHNNGGFAVNIWWESNVQGLFVIGELAGTHGVKRPGGSALNSGQVGGLRAAQAIVHRGPGKPPRSQWLRLAEDAIRKRMGRTAQLLESSPIATLNAKDVCDEVRRRMTRSGGTLREIERVRAAVVEARQLYRRLRQEGMRLENEAQIPDAIRAEQMCLTHIAYLRAIEVYLDRGGGSRGSYMVIDRERGREAHPLLGSQFCLIPENKSLRSEILEVRYLGDGEFDVYPVPVRSIPQAQYWFENTWGEYRSGGIFDRTRLD